MKPNQIEKEILEKFDETFELSLDNDDSILFTIRNYGEKNYENATEGMSLIKQFISDSLSTYRTRVEKENDINIKNAYLKGIADGRKQIGECCMGGCGNVNCKHCK